MPANRGTGDRLRAAAFGQTGTLRQCTAPRYHDEKFLTPSPDFKRPRPSPRSGADRPVSFRDAGAARRPTPCGRFGRSATSASGEEGGDPPGRTTRRTITPALRSTATESSGSRWAAKASRRSSAPFGTSRTWPLMRARVPLPDTKREYMCCICEYGRSSYKPTCVLAIVPRVFVRAWACNRCGHRWLPRIRREPKRCPKCRSPYWNKRRVRPSARRS